MRKKISQNEDGHICFMNIKFQVIVSGKEQL